jgi:hypothetical protein
MTKLNALITTLILGTSSIAMAQPTVTFSAKAKVSTQAPVRVVVRDHRAEMARPEAYVRFDSYDGRYDKYDRQYHRRAGARQIDGTYTSNYGVVRLNQMGDRVTGTYETGGGGVIKGRIIDGVLYFRWKQRAGTTDGEGHGVWVIEGRKISGTWGTQHSDANGGQWNLEKVSRRRR